MIPLPSPRRLFTGMVLALLTLPLGTLHAAEKADPAKLSLERIFANEFNPESVAVGPWWPKVAGYAVMERGEGKGQGNDLVRVSLPDGKKEVIASARHFIPPGGTAPLAIQKYTFSADGSRLLIYTNSKKIWRRSSRGDYWIYDITTHELKQLGGDAPPSSLMNAQLSPDGRRVC